MFTTLPELHEALTPVLIQSATAITIIDETRLRNEFIDQLIDTAVFTPDEELRKETLQLIRKIATAVGVKSASIHTLYRAFGRGEVAGFTVPACNIRTLTYDIARTVFRVANAVHAGAFIFEIARSEMGYTHQQPEEYSASILAAAIKENFKGPVFIQGDHYQVNAKKYASDPEAELTTIQTLIEKSLQAKFYNIDIDASTLVDLTKSDLPEQQRANYEVTAALTKFIRQKQPTNMTISIGGEIGHIGGKNSTPEDFEAFMAGYVPRVKGLEYISKVSVQTGTSHGGVVLPDGSMAAITLDFPALSRIGKIAREKWQLGGAVQHGASTLPNELFGEFTKAGTLEIHLATGFQNIVFQTMPQALRTEMEAWALTNLTEERDSTMTDEQCKYKLRKKAFGPFKEKLWHLSQEEKGPIMQGIEDQYRFLFDKLNVQDTKDIVTKYVS